jgi:hypothetical protein
VAHLGEEVADPQVAPGGVASFNNMRSLPQRSHLI